MRSRGEADEERVGLAFGPAERPIDRRGLWPVESGRVRAKGGAEQPQAAVRHQFLGLDAAATNDLHTVRGDGGEPKERRLPDSGCAAQVRPWGFRGSHPGTTGVSAASDGPA
jgi:hypothetical protein